MDHEIKLRESVSVVDELLAGTPYDANEYQRRAEKTSSLSGHRGTNRLVMAAMGLGGESGEVVDLVKKLAFHDHPQTPEVREKLKKELGDVLWYVAEAASTLDLTLGEIMEANIEKLQKRYGEKFSAEKSINRTE